MDLEAGAGGISYINEIVGNQCFFFANMCSILEKKLHFMFLFKTLPIALTSKTLKTTLTSVKCQHMESLYWQEI